LLFQFREIPYFNLIFFFAVHQNLLNTFPKWTNSDGRVYIKVNGRKRVTENFKFPDHSYVIYKHKDGNALQLLSIENGQLFNKIMSHQFSKVAF
jgi:hypothetical protein